MTKTFHRLTLISLALAASVQLAACGGGSAGAPDIFPPTVVITSDAADTASGPVTFTFNFNEDVGSSFTADDIVVTGGTPGPLTRVSATQYTMVVTPPETSAGTIQITVAAASFSDDVGNLNAVNPTVAQAFNTGVVAACGTSEPTCAPTTAVPSGALVIYSDAASVSGLNMAPDWGQANVTRAEVTIASNKSQQYVFGGAPFLYQGITWETNPQDVSSKGKLHLDVWTADVTSVKVSLISEGAENAVTKTLTPGEWNSLDIDLSEYTSPDLTKVIQIKIEPSSGGTIYVDNIYFHGTAAGGGGCGTTEPTCAPSTAIPSGALVIYSDAASVSGLNMAPDWGQANVTRSEVTIASNKSQQYIFGGAPFLYQGVTWESNPQDVSTKGKLHMDVWSADVTSLKVSLIGGGSENGITKTLTPGAWNSLDIDLSAYTSPDLTQAIQLKLEPNSGGTIYVDNIYFYGSASGGSGGSTAFVNGIFAADYQGNLGAGTAKSTLGGNVGFFLGPQALFDTKAYDYGGVAGTAVDPNGVPNFYYGIGKTLPARTDGYFGAFVNAPGNASADASAYAKIKLKFWGNPEQWEQSNFTANVDVLVQGPQNLACTNGAGRPELLKTVAAQKIGAGSDYTIAKTEFTLVESCGGVYTLNSVWSAIGAVVVRLAGENLQYVNVDGGGAYPTGINMGPISFIN